VELLFYNLIDNAIKFNDKKSDGFVEINFLSNDKYWQFFITDNGKGIEKQYFDKIFIAFQKLDNDFNSTGIGLSIVKKTVETYLGEIWLKSKQNEETTFYFTLLK
jgi:signal transduction histidine kinase